MSWNNHDALHRHACHAYNDYCRLRQVLHDVDAGDLWHSISHHLRHVVYRSGHEVSDERLRIKDVRRSRVGRQHK